MVKEEIIGGLRIAVSKGHNLEDAMQTFYNAGYKKEDIEAAAREFKSEQISLTQNQSAQQNLIPSKPPLSPVKKPIEIKKPQPTTHAKVVFPPKNQLIPPKKAPSSFKPQTQQQRPTQFQAPKTPPTVSNYSQTQQPQQKKGIDVWTVVLIIILALLLGVLASTFFFKQTIIEFLNKFLS